MNNLITKNIKLKIAEETIASIALSKDNGAFVEPKFIYLHGAGTGVKEDAYYIAQPIVDNGMNVLSIDFSGHGESTGDLKKSSLKKRVLQAKSSIESFSSTGALTICGVSMGGYIAIKLLELYMVETLILVCPALYDEKAYDVEFDSGFTEIIRAKDSFFNTDVKSLLESYTGKLLIIIGDNDAVIPAEVIQLIDKHTPNARKKECYTIPSCPHRIWKWVQDNDNGGELIKIQNKIIEYINAP